MENNIIYGRNAVTELLGSDKEIDTVYINIGNANTFAKIIAEAKNRGVIVKNVSGEKLSQMCGGANTQGIAALLSSVVYSPIEEMLIKKDPFIIICDGIEDPHNLGAIIRTAESAGADGIIIPKRRSCGVTGTVFKTSAGAAAHIKIARVSNLGVEIEKLKKRNIWIYGADMDGQPYNTVSDYSGGIALVIGGEGFGLSEKIKKSCDFLLSIPMFGKINSLNASVAAGILMYGIKSGV